MKKEKALVCVRRDLCDRDHAALGAALADAGEVHYAFVLDRVILDLLPSKRGRCAHIMPGSAS